MSRLALVGDRRMGRLVEQLAPEHGFEVALPLHGAEGGAGITRVQPGLGDDRPGTAVR
jgi:hypothetical protein